MEFGVGKTEHPSSSESRRVAHVRWRVPKSLLETGRDGL